MFLNRSKVALPCSKSYSIINTIQCSFHHKNEEQLPTSVHDLVVTLIYDHLSTCIHCCLHYLIYAREQYNISDYFQDIRHGVALANRFLFKKFINNQQYFNVHFQLGGNASLIDIKHFMLTGKSSYNRVLAELVLWLKSENMKFLFISNNNAMLLKSMYNCFLRMLTFGNRNKDLVETFVCPMLNITRRIRKQESSLRSVICNLNQKNKESSLAVLDIVVKVIKHILSPIEQYAFVNCSYYIMNGLNECKCGNVICKKKYIQRKYGISFSQLELNQRTLGTLTALHTLWKNKKVINKWYICSGCKCIKYCSRYCQKISWNKQNHAFYCKKIQHKPII
eukprot:493580_1